MTSFTSHIESVLVSDDLDRVHEGLGESEQHVAQTVLFLASVPALTIPILCRLLKKSVYVGVTLLLACLVSLYLVTQHKLDWIVALTQRLKIHERVRI